MPSALTDSCNGWRVYAGIQDFHLHTLAREPKPLVIKLKEELSFTLVDFDGEVYIYRDITTRNFWSQNEALAEALREMGRLTR